MSKLSTNRQTDRPTDKVTYKDDYLSSKKYIVEILVNVKKENEQFFIEILPITDFYSPLIDFLQSLKEFRNIF